MNSILNLTVNQLTQAVKIKDQIASLENKLARILRGQSGGSGRTGKRIMSAAARAKIAAAQRKRWAKTRGKVKVATKPKRKMSAAARAKISAMAKARWRAAKRAGKKRL